MKVALMVVIVSMMTVSVIQSAERVLHVGDPGVLFNDSLINLNKTEWPQMERWSKAGVRGGIPFLDKLQKGATVTSYTSDGINEAIKNCPSGKYVFLPNGKYIISAEVTMKNGVYLVGESRDSVICEITMKSGQGFSFYKIKNSGIYQLTIQGGWGKPKYDWNIGSDVNYEMKDNSNVSVKFKESIDCFLDGVNILNSGHHPMRCSATHTTFRDVHVDGCHNKAGGAQGYFFILGSDNLIANCYITHIRHISLQGRNVEYNVVYKNNFHQEISFHSGDNGNNLIEQNSITLPADMPGIQNPNYYAIMGPWSTKHVISNNPNYLFRNSCLELNQGHNSATPWSDDSIVYWGPWYVKPDAPLTNFTKINPNNSMEKQLPVGGTLYPIMLTTLDSLLDSNSNNIQEPYSDSAIVIPGVVEAENFDKGGDGVSYHDEDTENKLGEYRTTGVDIQRTDDSIGNYNIGYIANGEWLEYTVFVEQSGSYAVNIRSASKSSGGIVSIYIDSAPIVDSIYLLVTADWQQYKTTTSEIPLTKGEHILRLFVEQGGFNFNYIDFQLNDVVHVQQITPKNEEIVQVYPNPIEDDFTIVVDTHGRAYLHEKILLVNKNGVIVSPLQIGENHRKGIAKGVYFIVTEIDGEIEVVKPVYFQ